MAYQDMSSNWAYKTPVLAADFNQLGENDNILSIIAPKFSDISIDFNWLELPPAQVQKIFIKPPILCDNFTLETGFSILGNLFVIARNSITINGNINSNAHGSSGGDSIYVGGQSGIIIDDDISGGTGGGVGGAAGGKGYCAGGGRGAYGDGGRGGGYIILIAPTITIATVNISSNGVNGQGTPLPGGGGAGGIVCIQYFDSLINNAASITATGGNGASDGLVKIEQITY